MQAFLLISIRTYWLRVWFRILQDFLKLLLILIPKQQNKDDWKGENTILHLYLIQDDWKEKRYCGKNTIIWQGIHSGNAILISFFTHFHPYLLITGLTQNLTRFSKVFIGVNAKIIKQLRNPNDTTTYLSLALSTYF